MDCVFGFGFRGELPAEAARLLAAANASSALRIAADLPSGTECDTGRACAGSFRADVTVALIGKKPAHVSYPARAFCGTVEVASLGVPSALFADRSAQLFETDRRRAAAPLHIPAPDAHKGTLGTLTLVCGSVGMAGACILAARAALRSGVGLVRIAADQRLYPVLAPALPECVFTLLPVDDPEALRERLRAALASATACAAGCGLGDLAGLLVPLLLEDCRVPLLLDADALNWCARHPELLSRAQAPLVLTPHPGEMARLCRDETAEIQRDRLGAAREKARETGAVVVLKGAATVIAAPNGPTAVNPTGDPGMAKGGSGDVLAGIIGSLLAQGTPPFDAAVTGAYIHGLAGDLCARSLGRRSMQPTDLLARLPEAFCLLTGTR